MLVYIAGPLTTGDLMGNVRAAVLAADELHRAGYAAIVPHLSAFSNMITPRSYESWMADDFEILSRCDAVLRIPGRSPGADRETDRARELGIPVATSVPGIAVAFAERPEPEVVTIGPGETVCECGTHAT